MTGFSCSPKQLRLLLHARFSHGSFRVYTHVISFEQLTLKALITTAADDIHEYFSIVFQRKIRLDVSSESSARIQMKKKKPYFLRKLKIKNENVVCCNFCLAF